MIPIFGLRPKIESHLHLLSALRSLERGECSSFFGQSPKNEPTLLFLRAKRAIGVLLAYYTTPFTHLKTHFNMKQVRCLLSLLCAILTLSVFGQTIDFDKVETKDPNAPFFKEPQDYRTLGIDVGVSYQTSDVRSVWGGWGIGLTYEKNMVHQEGGAFDLGVRGRLMYANSKGYDNRATVGVRDNPVLAYQSDASYFANYLTHQGELAAEGVLTFNKLREKVGVYATLFGGIGIVGYDVRLDQLDANGAKYNYKSLGATPTVAEVRAFHDGNFETSRLGGDTLTGTGFMPSIGGELGFQVSPKFMIVLGHKWMFTQTDLFDGKEYINNVDKGVRKDFHQYTSLQLKWILGKRKPKQEYPQQQQPTTTYPTQTTPTQTNPTQTTPTQPSVKLPVVRFIAPNSNLETERERLPIVVKIDNVSDYPSVNLTINGRDNRDFALRNGELTSDVLLQEGKNTINVWARNAAGSSSDNVTITLRRLGTTPTIPTTPTTTTPTTTTPTRTTPAPTTTVRPSVQISSIGNLTNDNFGGCKTNIEARVDNVSNRNDIRLTINGRAVSNFNFDNNTKILRGSLSLASGSNRIIITAKNDAGNSSDERTVSCVQERPRVDAPTVRISSPANNARVSENTVSVEAKVSGVTNRNGVKVYINGAEDRNFSFDVSNQTVRTTANVRTGQNTIVVRAQNETSNAESRVNVIKRAAIELPPPPPVKTPPTVVITNPVNGSLTMTPSVNLVANAENVVESRVSVLLNGQAVPFTLSGRQIRAALNLPKGESTVTVRATNNDGVAEKSIKITYEKKKQSPDAPATDNKTSTDVGGDTELPTPTVANFNATQPVIDPFDPKPAVSVVTATIANVKNTGQIELYVNGAQQTNFTFDAATQQLRWSFQPKGGVSYTFNIVAKNSTGRTSKTEVVKF
ncbi:MAG: Ig-like domain-containing protein [Saprospiraceae bacterium]|nr:Ig-like domain-containing protein [Saprospiraceae bacterium]